MFQSDNVQGRIEGSGSEWQSVQVRHGVEARAELPGEALDLHVEPGLERIARRLRLREWLATLFTLTFASAYALFSGVVFLSAMAFMMAPVLHRIVHAFHLSEK